jgi:CO/xanthine dehydrogenase Mo-binding subunit
MSHIGASVPRIDAQDKVHGRTVFTDNMRVPGMLYAAVVTSSHAHALIRRIDAAVGGGSGGKAETQQEPLAYLLSRELGGRPVRVANTREQDLTTSPGRLGIQARIRRGATSDGRLTAADIEFLFDCGGYADYAVNVSRAAGYSCTGPYRVPNVSADSLSVYTNHPFATAYRGFGHIEMTFCVERAMDLLAEKLGMDPVQLCVLSAVVQGDTTPTQGELDENTGDIW